MGILRWNKTEENTQCTVETRPLTMREEHTSWEDVFDFSEDEPKKTFTMEEIEEAMEEAARDTALGMLSANFDAPDKYEKEIHTAADIAMANLKYNI